MRRALALLFGLIGVASSFPQGLSVLIYAVADPDNAIAECNDGNNTDAADQKVTCGSVQ